MKTRRFFSLFFLLVLMASLVLTPASAADEESGVTPPELHCEAMLLVDANTGRMVYGKNEHEQMYPASLTKIMTALLVLEAVDSGQLSLDQQITATESAMEGLAADGSTAGIQAGEILTVEQLLQCMLIVSANEACNILAEQVSGSVDAFVDAMNAKAEALGCEGTHFVNATGLHDSQHYTTAWDLYLITKEAMKHEDFMRICDTARATIPATNLSEERNLYTTNYLIDTWRSLGYIYSNARATIPATNLSEERNLYTTNYLIDTWRSLGYIYSNAHGIKTGSTDEAGHCLVSSATEGSLSFISVALGGPRETLADGEIRTYSFFDTREMFKWAFQNFSYQTVLEETELVKEVSVALSKVDHVSVHPASDVEVLLPNGTDPASLKRTLDLESPLDAPITEGQVLGTLTLSLNDEVVATVDLLASHDVEASGLLVFGRNVQNFFSSTAVKVVGIVLLVLAAALVLWKLTVGRRRYRYGRSVTRRSGGGGYRGRRRR